MGAVDGLEGAEEQEGADQSKKDEGENKLPPQAAFQLTQGMGTQKPLQMLLVHQAPPACSTPRARAKVRL